MKGHGQSVSAQLPDAVYPPGTTGIYGSSLPFVITMTNFLFAAGDVA